MTRSRGPTEPANASTPTMSIGEVLAVLKPEFADITVSKLRFLEGAGLVSPKRTAAGYRKFSDDDIARLRFVLRAQRDQYLPLRVIRQRLTDLESAGALHSKGAPPEPEPPVTEARPAEPGLEPLATPARPRQGPPAQLTRDELCAAAGRDPADLAALEAFGLISARGAGERGPVYSPDDLVVLRICGELASFGIEPRHLRMYKTFAEREASLFGQVTAPLLRQRNPDSHRQAQRTVERLSELCAQLHGAILRTMIRPPDQPR